MLLANGGCRNQVSKAARCSLQNLQETLIAPIARVSVLKQALTRLLSGVE